MYKKILSTLRRYRATMPHVNPKHQTEIADLKHADDELRRSEEKFRNLFNNSEVGMFRTRLNGSEILDFNEKYLQILGYSSDEFKKQAFRGFMGR